jgi:adenosylhomocysteine nucleosidase
MSRSKMSTSTSHEPRSRMSSFEVWSAAARSAASWALLVFVLNAAAASQNTAASISQAGVKNRQAAGCLTDCTPRFGIVSAFGNEADLLVAKTVDRREYRINGNVFTTGVLDGNPTVIVLTGQSIENAAMITQLLIDHFKIHHLLLSGIAGGLNDANHIGDVVVPDKWSLPLEGYWNGSSEVPVPCGKAGDLSCVGEKLASVTSAPNSDFQVQTPAGPASTGLFMRDTFVMTAANSPQGEFKFDYAVDPEMLRVAHTIKPELDRCGPKNRSLCVSSQPRLVIGGRGVTISTFLANSTYREYLSQKLAAVSVDMETAAFAHVAYANSIPFLAFRALSDQAGGIDYKDVGVFFGSGLAETNESRVTLAFLQAWSKAYPNHIPQYSH